MFNVDAPIYISGVDVIRFVESDYCKDGEYKLLTTEAEQEAALKRYLVDICRGDVKNLLEIEGFYGMSMAAKKRYVALCGFPELPEDQLVKRMALEGM